MPALAAIHMQGIQKLDAFIYTCDSTTAQWCMHVLIQQIFIESQLRVRHIVARAAVVNRIDQIPVLRELILYCGRQRINEISE